MAPDFTNVTWMLRTQCSVTALFFLGSVPSTAAPPTSTRSTLTRVRLAVSGLGGCFCQQSFNERKWNTSPSPLPPSLAQLSVVAGLIGLQHPASSLQSSSGNATSSVFRKLRHHSSGLLSGRCLCLQVRWTVDSPTRFSVHVFVQLMFY